MSFLKFTDSESPASADELTEVEIKLGATLPVTYRNFLAVNNGGLPEPNVVDIEGLSDSPTDIQVFFGTRRNFPSSTLAWNIDEMKSRHPNARLLPIARDSGGNLFCLKTDPVSYGEVIYLDIFGGSYQSYLVATEFDRFLKKIRDFKE